MEWAQGKLSSQTPLFPSTLLSLPDCTGSRGSRQGLTQVVLQRNKNLTFPHDGFSAVLHVTSFTLSSRKYPASLNHFFLLCQNFKNSVILSIAVLPN